MEGKMTWVVPTTEVQKFAANENVAACTVKFVCDVQVKGDVFTADGTNLSPDHDGRRYYYNPCSKELDLAMDSNFVGGFVVNNGGNDALKKGWNGGYYEKIPCIIWQTADGDVHATANTDMTSWERNHS